MRGLTTVLEAPSPVAAAARQVLDRRLNRTAGRPIAIALSGGGDSVALALIAAAWAARHGRPLVVLTVDHRLQPASGAWTLTCAELAARLGATFQALAWEGPKPATGLPAAARAVRHRLLAEAARAAGARTILLGHTADDRLEARAMREAGATTPDPREWSASPSWPHGRGVFLLRPLLDIRRADLRAWLTARGETWIEDPANSDPRSLRARVREAGVDADPSTTPEPPCGLSALCETDAGGGIHIPRAALRTAAPDAVRRFIALASVCAGGGARRPSAASLDRAASLLAGAATADLTLAGARIVAGPVDVLIAREAGEAARGGLAPLDLAPAALAVWDGRFEITADHRLVVGPLAGSARRLPPAQARLLRDFAPSVRAAMPAVATSDGVVSPVLATLPGVTARSLVADRLRAAAGLVSDEPDGQVAPS